MSDGPPGMRGAEYYLSCGSDEELKVAVDTIMACNLSHHFAVHKDTFRIFASGIAFGITEPPICGCLRGLAAQLPTTSS